MGGTEGWAEYVSADHGFSFRHPPDWTVEEDLRSASPSHQHLLWLRPQQDPLVQVSIGFKLAGEDVGIQRTGVGAGDLASRGGVLFLGQDVERIILVARGLDRSVLYAGGGEIQRGDLLFTLALDYIGPSSDDASLSQETQSQVDGIVASFQLSL
jgi:hypothetical protein